MKIRPMGTELFHAEGQTHSRTNMAKSIVAIHNFANANTLRNQPPHFV